MTEDRIATALLEQGSPKRDIVLGFPPPYVREQMEFAVT
ncbi:MAG: element excision factor XisI family protein [Caldilineaceae bacterium]